MTVLLQIVLALVSCGCLMAVALSLFPDFFAITYLNAKTSPKPTAGNLLLCILAFIGWAIAIGSDVYQLIWFIANIADITNADFDPERVRMLLSGILGMFGALQMFRLLQGVYRAELDRSADD